MQINCLSRDFKGTVPQHYFSEFNIEVTIQLQRKAFLLLSYLFRLVGTYIT